MKILAFDQSVKNTGWCVYDPDQHLTAMTIGSFKSAPDKNMSVEQKGEKFGIEVKRLFVAHKPDFVAWEAADDFIRSYQNKGKGDLLGEQMNKPLTVSVHQLMLRDLQGQLRQSCIDWKVPWVKVAPSTWRKVFLGKGSGIKREEAKKMAKAQCSQLGLVVKSGDEAEAVGIAFWAAGHCQELKLKRQVNAA